MPPEDQEPADKNSMEWKVWAIKHPDLAAKSAAPTTAPPTTAAPVPAILPAQDQQRNTNSNADNTNYTSGTIQNIGNNTRNTVNTQGTNSNGTDISNTTTRRYLDIPTPDEFLDDFRTGFSTYITDQMRSGSVSGPQATWLMQNEALFLGNYLGKLGDMARSGQQIFRPVGMNANNQYLGDRQGNVTSGVNTQTNTSKTTGTQTSNDQGGQYQGSVKNGTDYTNGGNITNTQLGGQPPFKTPWYNNNAPPFETGQSDGQGGGEVQGGQYGAEVSILDDGGVVKKPITGIIAPVSPVLQGQNSTLYNNQQGKQTNQNTSDVNTINDDTNTNNISDIKNTTGMTTSQGNQTEQLYSRNNLAYVKSLAPYDYMSGAFSPGALGVMYEGMKNQPRFSETGVSQPKLQIGGV